jgi:hypothetical protein
MLEAWTVDKAEVPTPEKEGSETPGGGPQAVEAPDGGGPDTCGCRRGCRGDTVGVEVVPPTVGIRVAGQMLDDQVQVVAGMAPDMIERGAQFVFLAQAGVFAAGNPEGAALDDGKAAAGNQFEQVKGMGGDIGFRRAFQVGGVAEGGPREAEVGEVAGQDGGEAVGQFMEVHKHREGFPEFPEGGRMEQAGAEDEEVGLQVARAVAVGAQAGAGGGAMDRESPEIDRAAVHFGKDLGKGIERAEEGVVAEDGFIEVVQASGTDFPEQDFLPGAGIEAFVGARQDIVGDRLQPGAAGGVQRSVGDDDQAREVGAQVAEQVDDVVIHAALGVVGQEDSEASRLCGGGGHGWRRELHPAVLRARLAGGAYPWQGRPRAGRGFSGRTFWT